jgi:K+/H+ antiporter YhaU regulatory subunit KhtT
MQTSERTVPIAERQVNQIIDSINNLESQLLVRDTQGKISLATPGVICNILPRLSILVQQAVDPMSQLDLRFRKSRAARFDQLLKEGIKKSPAMDQLKMEVDLIEMEAAVNRISNFVKLTQSTITTFQTNLRLQTGMAAGNL